MNWFILSLRLINMELSILYFKGLLGLKISKKKYDVFLALNIVLS